MSILNRILVASILIYALFPGAYSASNPTVNKDVVALRETVIALTGDPDLTSAIDTVAVMQVRLIGANDPAWRPDNPNWTPVLNVVRDDLNRDVGILLMAQLRDIADRWDHALLTHLTSSQIHELLKFYRSDVGQRYLRFQKQLRTLQQEGASAVVVNLLSGDPKGTPETSVTAAQIKTRNSVAALSWVYAIIPELASGASSSPGASPDAAKILNDMMVDALSKVRGPELDQLGTEYGNDLRSFAIFQGSPAAKALIAVYGFVATEMQADPSAPGTAFTAALQRSVEQHKSEWKAAYEAGRVHAH